MKLGQKVWVIFVSVNKGMKKKCSACEGEGKVQTIISHQPRACAKCEGSGVIGIGNSVDYFLEEAIIVGISSCNKWLSKYLADPNNKSQKSRNQYFLDYKNTFVVYGSNDWFYSEEIFTKKYVAEQALGKLKSEALKREEDAKPDSIKIYPNPSYQRVGMEKISQYTNNREVL